MNDTGAITYCENLSKDLITQAKMFLKKAKLKEEAFFIQLADYFLEREV